MGSVIKEAISGINYELQGGVSGPDRHVRLYFEAAGITISSLLACVPGSRCLKRATIHHFESWSKQIYLYISRIGTDSGTFLVGEFPTNYRARTVPCHPGLP
jgi:hypothetical protein